MNPTSKYVRNSMIKILKGTESAKKSYPSSEDKGLVKVDKDNIVTRSSAPTSKSRYTNKYLSLFNMAAGSPRVSDL